MSTTRFTTRKMTAKIRISDWTTIVVVVLDRGHDPRPDPGPAEDRLGQDRSAQEAANLQADHRGHRQPGVAHDVPVARPASGSGPWPGPSGRSPRCVTSITEARVIRVTIASGIEPSAIAGRIRCAKASDDGLRVARQDGVDDREVGHRRRRRAAGRCGRSSGSQWSWTAKMKTHRVAQDEDRDRDTEQRHDRDDAVDPAVRVARRQPAQGDAQADREDQGANRELDRHRELQGRKWLATARLSMMLDPKLPWSSWPM